jgi:hypothetical protein
MPVTGAHDDGDVDEARRSSAFGTERRFFPTARRIANLGWKHSWTSGQQPVRGQFGVSKNLVVVGLYLGRERQSGQIIDRVG